MIPELEGTKKALQDAIDQGIDTIRTLKSPWAESDEADLRYRICESCPDFTKFTHQCSHCKCVMNVKVLFKLAECPIERWTDTELRKSHAYKQ